MQYKSQTMDFIKYYNGTNGTPGKDGADGQTTYFHVKYSSVANPTKESEMTETPSKYIGTYVDYTKEDSSDPSDYAWVQFMGDNGKDGENGIPGTNGADGKTYYLHIKYSDDGGKTFTGNNGEDSGEYIGVYTDITQTDSSDVKKYTWSLMKGTDGKNSYVHIKYSNDGSTFTENSGAVAGDWMGICITETETAPTDFDAYEWYKIKGEPGTNGLDGKDGVAGSNGTDGKTTYFHVKYSSVANPTAASQMTETPSKYIGTYVDYTEADSTDPSDYAWVKFMGDDGIDGKDGEQGIPGTNGADGQTYYLHIKYSDDGGKTFTGSNGETSGKYIGVYTDTTQADSSDVSKYTWSLIKGADGENGNDGQDGTDGTTYYTWIKYADTPTSGMSDSPDGKTYIGISYNNISETESTNYSDYKWSLIKGADGEDGAPGKDGEDGIDARSYILEQSSGILKRQKNNSIFPNFIEYSAYYRDGQSTERTPYYGVFVIEESTDGETWNQLYESTEAETSIRHELYSVLATAAGEAIVTADGSAIGIPRDVVNIRCTLYTPDKADIIDIQTAVVVTDVDGLTHEEMFNLLTKNGAIKGIYKEGDQLYISFTYAKGGTLALGGVGNENGELIVYDNEGNAAAKVNYDGFTVIVEYSQDGSDYTLKGMRFNSKGITFVNESYTDGTFMTFDYDSSITFDPETETLSIYCDYLTCYNAPKLYNLAHVSSGSYVVFGSDGATLAYLASSSKRYKDIDRRLNLEDVAKAYDVDVYLAKYKDGYLDKDDDMNGQYMPMFLAEDIAEKIPSAAVYKDGEPEDWNLRVMVPVMYQMLKGQKEEIESLRQEIKTLKEGC